VPANLLELRGFAGNRVYEAGRALASIAAKSINSAFSDKGYVTIHATKLPRRLRHTGNGMHLASKKQSFGQDLVEAMKLVLAHHRGEVKLERVLPKRYSYKATPKQRPIHGK
jgi:hypothetical protein